MYLKSAMIKHNQNKKNGRKNPIDCINVNERIGN